MFERFTERARQVIVLAQEEARLLEHNYVGTEHLLLGLVREEHGLAARVLYSFGINAEVARTEVARIVAPDADALTGQRPLTPRTKRVLGLAVREALSMGHNYVGTEHLLLGMVRLDEGVAARILHDLNAGGEEIRTEVIRQEKQKPKLKPSVEPFTTTVTEAPFRITVTVERLA